MKERPILFSAPMVKAVLAGAKTVTRRVCKVQPFLDVDLWNVFYPWGEGGHGIYKSEAEMLEEFRPLMLARCPYGAVGDRLWVRENWRTSSKLDSKNATQIGAECLSAEYEKPWCPVQYKADGRRDNWDASIWGEPGKLRPSIYLPRWASRLTLEVTSVKIEPLHAITDEEAKAEGAAHRIAPCGDLAGAFDLVDTPIGYRNHFRDLWDSINGKRKGCAWDDNPWLFVVSFKRIESEAP